MEFGIDKKELAPTLTATTVKPPATKQVRLQRRLSPYPSCQQPSQQLIQQQPLQKAIPY